MNDEIVAWQKKDPYVFSKYHDPQGHFHGITVDLIPAPDWDRWSLIFGDFISNLRAALDHFVYAVAVNQTKTVVPADEGTLQFPITDTTEEFARQRYRIRSLGEAVRTSIERVQPYNRGHQLLPPLLGLLRDFDNCNKHRLLKVARSWQHTGHVQIDCPLGHRPSGIGYLPGGEIQNRADLVGFTIDPPCLDVKYEYKATLSVCISHNPGPTGIEATAVRKLTELLAEEVRTIINVVGAKV